MLNLKRLLIGMLAFTLLGMQTAPRSAAAQAGTRIYDVTITNITNSMQALSPPIIATHPASVHAWQMGQPASAGLEKVAEEGMSDVLASEIKGSSTDVVAAKAHLFPGDSITLRITAKDGDVLSAATMLIQTNDGFTGLDAAALTDGNTDTMAYDAGTEENTELKADVPGPPFGGKMHGPDTNPRQPIAMHPGISSKADVTADFNWSGPVARFTIKSVDPASTTPTGPTYDVTITNITNSMQALSPPIIATHPSSAHAWQMGQPASKGLELVAEEGMSDMLASEVRPVATDVVASHAHLLPGDSITLRITAKDGDVLSAATMLIQTNDGFTGLDAAALSDGNTDTMAYDAGTEDNTELKADVPGPPFGGKMHGPETNPRQPIATHEGITAKADVTPDFNWNGPVARFTIQTVSAPPTVAPPVTQPAATPVATPAASTGTGAAPAATPTTSTMMPTMPKTGAGDGVNALWIIAVLAAMLSVAGLTVRRVTARQKR
jgi:hypothetical protein